MHGFTALGETNSVPPLLSNTGSTMSRDVYNVVSNSQIGFGTAINQVLFGSNSQVYQHTNDQAIRLRSKHWLSLYEHPDARPEYQASAIAVERRFQLPPVKPACVSPRTRLSYVVRFRRAQSGSESFH